MKAKYLLTHLGLGDHITTNALVRTLVDRWSVDKLYLFCRRVNVFNVQFMYRDDPRIEVLAVEPCENEWDQICHRLLLRNIDPYPTPQDWESGSDGEFFKVGFDRLHALWFDPRNGIRSCDQGFYVQAGIPYEHRFSKFFMQRDLEAEESVFHSLKLHSPYIFQHDYSDAHPIVPSFDILPRDRRIIKNRHVAMIPVMLMGRVLERAVEIHVPNSSFRCLIDCPLIDMSKTKLFLHNFRGGVDNSIREWTLVRQDLTTELIPPSIKL